MVTVLAGGVGAARFLSGLVQVVAPADVTAIVNVGDDIELHGLHISPDIDTVIYTLAGAINVETGWGLAGETWHAMDSLRQYGNPAWFNLGDRDLGTHLYRTTRLNQGASLTDVTGEIARAWGLELQVLPATDDRLRTMITVDSGDEITFQEYFVREKHAVPVAGVRFDGAHIAEPTPSVVERLTEAETIVVAPSNPLVSIEPILTVASIREILQARRDRVVAVSPIVGGAAIKGPADRMLRELGHEASAVGVARLYADLASVLVIDEVDASLASAVEATGMRCVVTPTVMRTPEVAAALARTTLAAVSQPAGDDRGTGSS